MPAFAGMTIVYFSGSACAGMRWVNLRPRESVHRFCERDIVLRDAAGIVGGEDDVHGLIDIGPFRVVVDFLRHQADAGHESERLVEILEGEFARDRIAPATLAPGLQFRP